MRRRSPESDDFDRLALLLAFLSLLLVVLKC